MLFSPVHGVLDPRTLSEWMLADGVPARLQLQLHKYIWPSSTRGASECAPVVLLSGGLDSYTAAAIARADGFALYALTIHYGQRHVREIDAARRVADALGVERASRARARPAGDRRVGADRRTPTCRTTAISTPPAFPSTYVPARNTIFLSLALGWAEVLGARDLVIGVNALDYSGYPDCRPEFIRAFETLAALGTRAGVEGAASASTRRSSISTKAEIIRRGLELGLDYALTHSCYDPLPDGRRADAATAACCAPADSAEAGVPDPLLLR